MKLKITPILVVIFSGWYNFGKIIKTVATKFRISKLKCTKFDFQILPQAPLGELTALAQNP